MKRISEEPFILYAGAWLKILCVMEREPAM